MRREGGPRPGRDQRRGNGVKAYPLIWQACRTRTYGSTRTPALIASTGAADCKQLCLDALGGVLRMARHKPVRDAIREPVTVRSYPIEPITGMVANMSMGRFTGAP